MLLSRPYTIDTDLPAVGSWSGYGVSGNVVTLFDSAHTNLSSLSFFTGPRFSNDPIGAQAAAVQMVPPPCYAAGTSIESSRLRYFPVSDRGNAMSSSATPSPTISPP